MRTNAFSERLPERDVTDRVGRLVVPAAAAVVTWLVVVVVLGLVLRAGPLSFGTLVRVAVIAFMLWPLVAFYPWRPGLTDRVLTWSRANSGELVLTAGLLAVREAARRADRLEVLTGLFDVPAGAVSDGFYATAFLYRGLAGDAAAALVLAFGRWYLSLLWLFAVATLLLGVVRAVVNP